jgi:hypothetical protein
VASGDPLAVTTPGATINAAIASGAASSNTAAATIFMHGI